MNEYGWILLTIFVGNTPLYIDMIVCAVVALASVTSWVAIAIDGTRNWSWRVFAAFGWSLLLSRLGWSIAAGDDPIIPPASVIAVILIATGATLANMEASFCDKLHCTESDGEG